MKITKAVKSVFFHSRHDIMIICLRYGGILDESRTKKQFK